MSEFLAEARILVRPDTTRFRATLEAELAAATKKPVVIPVVAAPTAAATASAAQLVSAQEAATVATLGLSTATGLEAAALDLATKAQVDAAIAAQAAGAAATAEAAQIEALARAQALSITAFKKSEAVAVAALGSTTELAGARATLRAATAAVAANEVAFDAALATTSDLQKKAAADALLEARAMQVSAEAAFDSAVAHKADAAAVRESSAAHAQATRGLAAETLALGGLRGATLAASAPFLIGATGAILFAKSIKEASDAQEEFNKTNEVFGERAKQIQEFAETTADALGISSVEALKAAGIFGNLFRSIQIGEEPAAQMSERLVRLAADLASFNNADPSRVLEALRSGLVGQARPLRVFGIFISQARAQQQALIDTQKKSIKELTNAELVQARYNIILRDSTLAQGDFERTSGRLANQTRILKAQIADLEGEIGRALIPALIGVIGLANDYVDVFGKAAKATEDFASKIPLIGAKAAGADSKAKGLLSTAAGLYFRFALLGPVVGAATLAVDKFGHKAEETGLRGIPFLQNALKGLAADFAAIASRATARGINDVSQQLNALQIQVLKTQTGLAPGGRSAIEENLRQQIELDKKAVAEAKSGSAARKQALIELKADQDELAQLQQQDASDAEKQANNTKAAAEDALKAREAADRALLDLQSQRRDDAARRAANAATTESLADDIRAQDRIQALIKTQIAKIRAQIKDEQTRREAIRELRIALIASRREEEALRRERAEQQSARRDEIQNLNIQIADERGNQNALARAIQIRINTLNKQIKAARGDQVKMKTLILERERLKNQLEEARQQQDDINKQQKSAAEKQFEFLQSLQGFSANLLGNLIPGFATGGLVGNTAAAGPAAGQPFDVGAGVRQGGALQAGAVAGVRPVQVDTTNALLRQILAALQGRHTQPPEIRHNRRTGSASFDTL